MGPLRLKWEQLKHTCNEILHINAFCFHRIYSENRKRKKRDKKNIKKML